MHISIRWLIVILAVVLFIVWRWWSGRGIQKLNSGALEALIKDRPKELELIDVREPGEFRGGHIAFAKNIPLGQIRSKLGSLPKDRDVVFVCQSGSRSMMAARQAKKAGLKSIYNLSGGMSAWRGSVKR